MRLSRRLVPARYRSPLDDHGDRLPGAPQAAAVITEAMTSGA
jgi:hypothetical protein